MIEYGVSYDGSHAERKVITTIKEKDAEEAIALAHSHAPHDPSVWISQVRYSKKAPDYARITSSDFPLKPQKWINHGLKEHLSFDGNPKGHPIQHQELVDKILDALSR